ncbi:hypothetical protein JXJ21_07145 [candidate division KSB1 bacterium]|nr:hypothetical protein [candidate division KSB1 bacterium]
MRNKHLMWLLSLTLLGFSILFIGCEKDEGPTAISLKGYYKVEPAEPDKLNAYPILGYMLSEGYTPPIIDGSDSEMIWDPMIAVPFEIQTEGGADGFAPKVTIQALYDNWYLYLYAVWNDATESKQIDTWYYGNPSLTEMSKVTVFDTLWTIWVTADSFYKTTQPIGRVEEPKGWNRVSDPYKGIVETTTISLEAERDINGNVTVKTEPTQKVKYDTVKISGDEDRFAIMWNINSANFLNCNNLCHNNTNLKTDTDETVDLWVWRAYRTNYKRVIEDMHLNSDSLVFDTGSPAYLNNIKDNRPWYVHNDQAAGRPVSVDVIYDSTGSGNRIDQAVVFSKLTWYAGQLVPGYVIKVLETKDTDVLAYATYNSGKWRLEMRRRLSTAVTDGSDIEFNPNSDANVDFHIAVYDNSRDATHAITPSAQVLHFLQLVEQDD